MVAIAVAGQELTESPIRKKALKNEISDPFEPLKTFPRTIGEENKFAANSPSPELQPPVENVQNLCLQYAQSPVFYWQKAENRLSHLRGTKGYKLVFSSNRRE